MWTHLDDSASEWWSLWDGVSSHFVAPLRRGFFGRLPKLNRSPSKQKQLFILSLTASEMSSKDSEHFRIIQGRGTGQGDTVMMIPTGRRTHAARSNHSSIFHRVKSGLCAHLAASAHGRLWHPRRRGRIFATSQEGGSTSASLIGRSGSSAFRLSTTPVSMSLTGSCFSSDSAPRPFHHGIRRRGGTIFRAALP
jgi:hypothetical protein